MFSYRKRKGNFLLQKPPPTTINTIRSLAQKVIIWALTADNRKTSSWIDESGLIIWLEMSISFVNTIHVMRILYSKLLMDPSPRSLIQVRSLFQETLLCIQLSMFQNSTENFSVNKLIHELNCVAKSSSNLKEWFEFREDNWQC